MNKKRKMGPLKHFINDKEELINQVFSCLSEKQIKRMVPTILKGMSMDELKAECLVQLLTMSNATIVAIIEGKKSYSTEDDLADKNNINDSGGKRSISEDSHTSRKKIKHEKENQADKSLTPNETENKLNITSECTKNSLKKKRKERKHKTGKKKKKSNSNGNKVDDENKGKSLLELLELEMRAKAIRSLLKQEEEELEKDKKQNEETKSHETNKISSKDEKEISSITEKLESSHKKDIKIKEIKTEAEEKNFTASESRDSLKEYVTKLKDEIEQQKDIHEANHQNLAINVANTTSSKAKIKTENYDWNAEEEKLIYEDDEYDSDEKVENETNKEEEKSEENSRSSWAERWLQSKDVKRVVATSKMLTVVRNKMKNTFRSGSKQTNIAVLSTQLEMEGSVKEYDTLLQMHEAVMASAQINKINNS